MKYAKSIALMLVLFVVASCGDGGPRLVKVTGTVTRNGKPYEGALVEFMPDRANTVATLGSDTTGPEGNYMIRSSTGRSGLSPGKYTVRISKASSQGEGSASGQDAPSPENDPGQKLASQNTVGSKRGAPKKEEGGSGTFQGEVTSSATILDFDVKTTAKEAAK